MRIDEEYFALGELWADSDNYCRGAGSMTTSQRKFVNTFLADTPLRATNHAVQYRDFIAASGIGANTAIISLINTLTLWTLPVRNPVNL